MTDEERSLLATLLDKAQKEDLLRIYDKNENAYCVDWAYLGYDKINIKIEQL